MHGAVFRVRGCRLMTTPCTLHPAHWTHHTQHPLPCTPHNLHLAPVLPSTLHSALCNLQPLPITKCTYTLQSLHPAPLPCPTFCTLDLTPLTHFHFHTERRLVATDSILNSRIHPTTVLQLGLLIIKVLKVPYHHVPQNQ